MVRNLDDLETLVIEGRASGIGSDGSIRDTLEAHWGTGVDDVIGKSSPIFDGIDTALTDNFFGAIATFLLALERGDRELIGQTIARLQEGLSACSDLNLLPQWWAHKVATHLIADLWDCTFYEKLPLTPAGGEAVEWPRLRDLFIAVLLRRDKAEIDLWPSQIAAAARSVDQADDLVVALPTSAGKTRIAELCILRCLAGGKRVVFVTPLRALSAQTEIDSAAHIRTIGKNCLRSLRQHRPDRPRRGCG